MKIPNILSSGNMINIHKLIKDSLQPLGVEFGFFKAGWYNLMVDYRLRLDCKEEDLGICLVSNPDYFEHFILTKCDLTDQHFIENPLDESRYLILNEAKNILNEFLKVHANYGYEIQSINSCDLDPVSRLPLIDVQVAAHVSGIAYLYKETSKNYTCPIPACENTSDSKHCGVSIHPIYGGWFSFVGCLILKNIAAEPGSVVFLEPLSTVEDDRVPLLLHIYQKHYTSNEYRNINSPKQRYSPSFIKFLSLRQEEKLDFLKWARSQTQHSSSN